MQYESEQLEHENHTSDFRLYLQNELVRRCKLNPQYSLRAYAKSLNVAHATLSGLLSGRRPFTKKSIIKLCQSLGLSPLEYERFTRAKSSIETAESQLYSELTLDTFVATSEWYYDAILELTKIKSFKPENKWIAKTLGLSVGEVNVAIERLRRLERLDVDIKGKWKDRTPNTSTIVSNDFTHSALRKYQKNILALSSKSVDETPIEARDHTSMSVAVRKSDIPIAKEKIKQFRRKLTAYLERSGSPPEEVYQIAISFFPLTKSK